MNTNETVTVRLIVAADGALRTLDQFDSAMTESANASVRTGAAVDAMVTHIERMRKAQEAGIPVLRARAAAISAEDRAIQNAVGRAEPLVRAQMAAERELSRVVAAASWQVVQGKMSEADAMRQVMLVEQAHVASINRVIDAQLGSVAATKANRAELEALATAERLAATSADGQSMWSAYAGVSEAQSSARESARVFEQELDRLDDIARMKAEQAGKAFASTLDQLFPTAVRSSARESASVFEAEFARLEEIAKLKAAEAGAAFQAGLNSSFGIGRPALSASSSAAVFEQAMREADNYAASVERLKTQLDPVAAAQVRANQEVSAYREMLQRGSITATQFADAQQMAAERVKMVALSVRQSADALQAYNMSSSRNAAESANIAMQFQDIAVSAQMGMNPMMVALQQGTQLSAIFTQMQNPLKALPAAFAAILHPVSLLTIGFVALSTVAIQWAMSLFSGAKDATTALEDHQKALESLLVGYGDLKQAADDAVDAALRLPKGVVQSDLETSLRAQEEQLDRIAAKSLALQDRASAAVGIGRAQGFDAGILEQLSALSSLNITINSTAEELDAATVAARELYNTTTDSVIREWADEFFQLTNQVRATQAILGSSKAALDELNMTDLSGMESWSDVSRELADWQDELDAAARRAAAGIQTSYQAAILAAQGYGQAAGAANVYAGSLDRLRALIPAVAAAQQAQNQLATAQIEYDRGVKALQEQQAQGLARDVFNERLTALTTTYEQAKDAVSGLTTVQQEQDRLTTQNSIDALTGKAAALARVNDQYKQQEQAILALRQTGASQAEVDRLLAQNATNRETALANASAEATSGGGGKKSPSDNWKNDLTNFQQRIAAQELEIELVGKSTYEIERQKAAFDLLNQAKQAGVAITPELTATINDMSAAYAQTTVELERMQFQQQQIDQINGALQQGFADTFYSIITGSKNAGEAIGDLLGQLGKLFINQAFQMLFAPTGVGGVGFGVGGGGGLLGGKIIPGILHNGGVAGEHGYSHGKAYSPAVWAGAPRYHNGGVAGLQPDEVPAILQRGETVLPRGAANDNGGVRIEQINIQANSEQEGAAAARGFARELDRHFPAAMQRYQKNPLRRAG